MAETWLRKYRDVVRSRCGYAIGQGCFLGCDSDQWKDSPGLVLWSRFWSPFVQAVMALTWLLGGMRYRARRRFASDVEGLKPDMGYQHGCGWVVHQLPAIPNRPATCSGNFRPLRSFLALYGPITRVKAGGMCSCISRKIGRNSVSLKAPAYP